MTTNSSTCKLEDKKEKKKEDRFNFWIYVSLIILVILLLSIFIYMIYSLLNSKNNTSNYSYQTSVYKATPPPPVMNITPPVIKTQPSFISSIFPKASSTTTLVNSNNNFKTPEIKKEVNSIISPLFTRQIIPPINKQMGGYIKLFKRF